MLIYNTWGEEKKEKFREITLSITGALSCSIKNAMLRQTNTKEESVRWNAVNKDIEKYGFTIDEVCDALEEFIYIG